MSKLQLEGARVDIAAEAAIDVVTGILRACGCSDKVAGLVARHLADASLCGVESHGLMRVIQYRDQFVNGAMRAQGRPQFKRLPGGAFEIDGDGGIGITAMDLAVEHACELAEDSGISALAIRNSGHTGRLGAFAEQAAERGFLSITMGGGNRKTWRQVAPHGGRRALLPTNPYCIGIPGGERGPVVLDFATSMIAGGWIYAAQSAGASLPEGALIDTQGNPSVDPQDYFDGGAILPAGGAKGYALALMAELIAEAMLGPVATECNWLLIAVKTTLYRDASAMRAVAEEILDEIRRCPPAAGFERVEIPGEREREHRRHSNGVIAVPEQTWQQILALANGT
jgi:LDH2 family malate/lactate/ureidoglycolate dehydrogenase